jgi:hypothetical protein
MSGFECDSAYFDFGLDHLSKVAASQPVGV